MKPVTVRIINFMVCLLLMAGAALNVNRSLLGNDLTEKKTANEADTVTAFRAGNDGTVVINTSSLTDVAGYSGKTPLEITVSAEGVIEDIETLPTTETKRFFKRASAVLDSIKGHSVTEAMTMQVDAVSGATLSSNALLENVHEGLALYSKEMHIRDVTGESTGGLPLKMWVALAVTLAACILPLFIHNKTYHTVQLCLNVIVLGFWCGKFLSYGLMVNWMSYGISMWGGLVAVLMLTAAFVYPLFGKPAYYCTHICPLGSAQQLAGMCVKKKVKMSVGLVKGLEWFRRVLWAVLMFCLWVPVMTEWVDYELFSAFLVESASWVILACGAAVIVLSFVIPRPYCRFICPTGTLLNLNVGGKIKN